MEDFTIGVEEEYQIVHAETRELVQRAARVLPRARKELGDEVSNELFLSQIEIGTPVCHSLAEVRDQLAHARRTLAAAAAREGSRIAAAGTHPFSKWEDQRVTPKQRYYGIAEDYAQVAREQIICGCHVHVGIADREAAIRVINRTRPWLATILALTGNSPYWMGFDTGYQSYRTEQFQRFPTVNVPYVLESRAEYDALVAEMIACEMIQDASKLYWDVRPSSHFETIEFRVADVCLTIDEAVLVAGLCRGLARECLRRDQIGEPISHARPEILRAAKWRASRYGLQGRLIDANARRAVPAAEAVASLLDFVRPALEASGDWAEVSALAAELQARGTGSARQRAAFAREGRLEDVVDLVAEETLRGTA